jgi:hypothetical protein
MIGTLNAFDYTGDIVFEEDQYTEEKFSNGNKEKTCEESRGEEGCSEKSGSKENRREKEGRSQKSNEEGG